MDRRNVLATLVGFGVAGLVLAVLATLVGVGEVLAAIGRARPGVVALVGLAIVAWLCLWGGALHAVATAVGADVSVPDAVLVHAGAAFANHVTPFGQAGGEPVAAWLLSDVTDTDVERALAAMTSFDAVNVVPSLTFAVLGLGYYAAVTTLAGRLRWIAGGVVVLAVVVPGLALLGWRHREAIESRLAGLLAPPLRVLGRLLPRASPPTAGAVEERLAGFVAGFERIAGDRRQVAIAICFSASGWLVQAVGLWLALYALGAAVPAYVPLFVVPMGTVASALPTPGGLGGIEAVQVALLTAATGVAASTLTGAVVIFSVGGFFLTTTVGAAATAALRARERGVGSPDHR